MLKLNKLFSAAGQEECYLAQITPQKEERTFLEQCRDKIRKHLRKGIQDATVSILGMPHAVVPRFRTQGSWSYDTCIRPASQPPQEMDWDYGVYLPVVVWEENGPPHVMAKLYFELVEGLLRSLCSYEGWKLVPGKETCIRVKVADWAHIDLPLYAAPEEQFLQIVEKRQLAKADSATQALTADSAEFMNMPEQDWAELDTIVMATRKGEWIKSDPEQVSRWFNDRALDFGPQLKRICRYIKGWRDFHWMDGGPSSVCLMIAIAQNFNPQQGRDDLTLEHAANHLASALLLDVHEPAIDDGEHNFNRLNHEERALAAQRARELHDTLRQARRLELSIKFHAPVMLRKQFGDRIPDKPDWIDLEVNQESIRNTEARRVSRPVVTATQAG